MSREKAGSKEAAQTRAAVVDIGGVFIYSDHPKELAEWYRRHLGIEWVHNEAEGAFYRDFLHRDHADHARVARTVLGILQRKGPQGPPGQVFMVNYRVLDLQRMVEQLKADSIPVDKVEEYDYGRFAWIQDPEGNRIELFEDRKF